MATAALTVAAQTVDTLPDGAVPARDIEASASVTAFRPIGELRVWSYYNLGKRFGQFSSLVKEGPVIDDRRAVELEERVNLDYSLIGTDRHDRISGRTYLDETGAYLGTQLDIGPDDSLETMQLSREGDDVSGYYTRGGVRQTTSMVVDSDFGAWDPDFVDQLELMLALKDLSIGTTFADSIVSPRALLKTVVSGQVNYFMRREITKGYFDSVFVIHLDRPFEGEAYFTANKRLVRTDFTNQRIRVYQDLVQKPSVKPGATAGSREARPQPTLTWQAVLFKLPYYIGFAMAGLLAMLMFSREAFRDRFAYVCFIGGVVMYVLIPQVQNPIVIAIISALLPDQGISGAGAYALAAVPPVFGGLFQTALVLLVLYGLFVVRKIPKARHVGYAVFLLGGFAVAEACYMSGLTLRPLFGWDGLGQLTLILFHVATGALLGGAFGLGRKHLIPAAAAAVLVNALLRYMPFLQQQTVVDSAVVHMLMAAVALSYIAAVLLLLRRLHI